MPVALAEMDGRYCVENLSAAAILRNRTSFFICNFTVSKISFWTFAATATTVGSLPSGREDALNAQAPFTGSVFQRLHGGSVERFYEMNCTLVGAAIQLYNLVHNSI